LQPAEVQEIIAAFSNADQVRANGIHVNGTKYLLLRADERSIYGKKVNSKSAVARQRKVFISLLK